MKPDLLGYALNSLEPRERTAAEDYLREHPEARGELQEVRRRIEPFSWDPSLPPPAGLADRTLQRVAALDLTHDRRSVPRFGGMSWRRMAQAAAVILVCLTALGVGVSWLGQLRSQRLGGEPSAVQLVACKDNLRKVFTALCAFGDANDRQFPNVAAGALPPTNVAALMGSILSDNGLLPADLNLACPVSAVPGGANLDYAYSLGYHQNGRLIGPRLEDGKPIASMPLMADSAPQNPLQPTHSLNHGGSGQNVLYCDGHVSFCTSRYVGVNSDDIFLNRAKQVAPGVEWSDAVLTSGQRPK